MIRNFQRDGKYNVSVIEISETTTAKFEYPIEPLKFKSLLDKCYSDNYSNNKNFNENETSEKTIEPKRSNEEGCDFEIAINATKYGKYNWFLLFTALWGYMSVMNSTTTMSLILPSAECDLNLTNFDKGMFNSAVYIGMICSGFFWGLISDVLGRRRVLLRGFAADALFSVLLALAQNYTFLLIIKLISGFINSSLIAILTTFVAECHAKNYRASITLGSGVFTSIGTIVLPLLAWIIIPNPTRLFLFNGLIYLSSWQIFLLVSSIPSLLTFIGLIFFCESPKFLMSKRKNEEALEVFQKIYSMNTGYPKETFPIKSLKLEQVNDENLSNQSDISIIEILRIAWRQMLQIFKKPYLLRALLPCVIQFFTILGVNTIRLWTPQLFALALSSETQSRNSTPASTVCDLLQPNVTYSIVNDLNCKKQTVSNDVYFDSMVAGIVTGIGYLVSIYMVKVLDRKWLLLIIYGISVLFCFGLFWSTTSNQLLATVSAFIALTSTAGTALVSIVIDTFPTFLRTTALSLCLTFGRSGAMVGNLVFPVLLDLDCVYPFIFLAVCLSVAAVLSLLLPKTRAEELK